MCKGAGMEKGHRPCVSHRHVPSPLRMPLGLMPLKKASPTFLKAPWFEFLTIGVGVGGSSGDSGVLLAKPHS